MIKIVTGIRRSGKSFLLFRLYYDRLRAEGVAEDHLITMDLDSLDQEALREPHAALDYVRGRIHDDQMYYVLIDEVQMMERFVEVLNSLLKIRNIDVYVTGSNSRFLSTDVATEFRGRGEEIYLSPLSMMELMEAFPDKTWDDLWKRYVVYGGLPQVVLETSDRRRSAYLKRQLKQTYLKDIRERYGVRNDLELEQLLKMVYSSVGSLTNPQKLSDAFQSMGKMKLSAYTIKQYLDYLCDAFLLQKAERYDIRGKRYISTPYKFYASDPGLRNALMNFRQVEETHLMENVIYNELIRRGYNVDVGVVEVRELDEKGNSVRKQIEVDFVVNDEPNRYYIQSAFALPDPEKVRQELRPLRTIPDSFRKIVVVAQDILPRIDEDGIVTIGLRQFLTNPHSLEMR